MREHAQWNCRVLQPPLPPPSPPPRTSMMVARVSRIIPDVCTHTFPTFLQFHRRRRVSVRCAAKTHVPRVGVRINSRIRQVSPLPADGCNAPVAPVSDQIRFADGKTAIIIIVCCCCFIIRTLPDAVCVFKLQMSQSSLERLARAPFLSARDVFLTFFQRFEPSPLPPPARPHPSFAPGTRLHSCALADLSLCIQIGFASTIGPPYGGVGPSPRCSVGSLLRALKSWKSRALRSSFNRPSATLFSRW